MEEDPVAKQVTRVVPIHQRVVTVRPSAKPHNYETLAIETLSLST